LSRLLQEYNKKKASLSKGELVKVLQAKAIQINKDSQKCQKEFKKGEITKKDFQERYGLMRREWH
jgi:hypothetical protein